MQRSKCHIASMQHQPARQLVTIEQITNAEGQLSRNTSPHDDAGVLLRYTTRAAAHSCSSSRCGWKTWQERSTENTVCMDMSKAMALALDATADRHVDDCGQSQRQAKHWFDQMGQAHDGYDWCVQPS
jgi:hypothetical protein